MLPRSEWRRPFLRRSWIFASLCLSVAVALALGAAWHVHRRGQSLSTAQARLVDLRTWHAALESRAAEEDRLAPSFHGFEAKGLIRREGEGAWLEEMRRALASEPIFLSPVIVGDEESHEGGRESGDRQGVRIERVDAGVERRFFHEEEIFAFFRRLRSKVGLPVSVTRCRVVRKAPSDLAVVHLEGGVRQEPFLAPDPLLEVACRLRWTRVVIGPSDPARRPPGVRQAAFEAGSFSIPANPASDIDSALDPIFPALPLDAFDRLLTTRKERDRLDRRRLSSALAMIRKVDSALPEPAEEPAASIEPAFEPPESAFEPPDPVFEPPEPEASSLDDSIVEAPAFRPRRFGGIIARSGDPRWIWIDGQRFEVDLLPSDAIAITDPYPAIRLRAGDRWVELLPGQEIDPITGNPSAPLAPDWLYRGRASGD